MYGCPVEDPPRFRPVVDLPNSHPVGGLPASPAISSRSSTNSVNMEALSSPTEYKVKTAEQGRIYTNGNPFVYEAKSAGPRQIHSPSPFATGKGNSVPFIEGPLPLDYRRSHRPPFTDMSPITGAHLPSMNPTMHPLVNEIHWSDSLQSYSPQWSPPPSPNSGTGPEMEKKMIAIEEQMKNQKLSYEKAQKEIADRDAAEATAKQNVEVAEAAEAELRARHIMIPWPSFWKRG
jgi:hypothetical protein